MRKEALPFFGQWQAFWKCNPHILNVRLPTSTTTISTTTYQYYLPTTTYLLLRTYYNVPTYLLLPSYYYLPFTTYCYYRPTYYYYYLHIVLSKFSLSGQLFQSGANAVKRVYYRYNNKVFTLNLRQLIDHHSRPLCLYNCLFNEVNSNQVSLQSLSRPLVLEATVL